MKSAKNIALTIMSICMVLAATEANAQFSTRSRISRAIKNGNKDRVSELAVKKVKTGKGFFNSNTLIGQVITSNNDEKTKIEMLNTLINTSKADPNEKLYMNGYKTYPLIAAISMGEFDLAANLIKQGAMVHVSDDHEQTAMTALLDYLKKNEKSNMAILKKAVSLSDNIIEQFSWSQIMDHSIESDEEAYSIYIEYMKKPVTESILNAWKDILAQIIGSHMADNQFVIDVIEELIRTDIKNIHMKKELMLCVLNEAQKRSMDVNQIMIISGNNSEIVETPLAMATRFDDVGSFRALAMQGAETDENTTMNASSLQLAERYGSNKVLKELYANTIKIEKALVMLKEYNFGLDNTNLHEQIDAAIVKMIIVGELRITDRELDLLFGPLNDFGVRQGGVYNYLVDNAEEEGNWIYIALFGAVLYSEEYREIGQTRQISKLISKGFSKTGIINLSPYLVTQDLVNRQVISRADYTKYSRAMELIKETSSIKVVR